MRSCLDSNTVHRRLDSIHSRLDSMEGVTARKVSENLTVTVRLRYTWGKMEYCCGMVIEANDEFFIHMAPRVAIDIHNDMRGNPSAKLFVVPWCNEENN